MRLEFIKNNRIDLKDEGTSRDDHDVTDTT